MIRVHLRPVVLVVFVLLPWTACADLPVSPPTNAVVDVLALRRAAAPRPADHLVVLQHEGPPQASVLAAVRDAGGRIERRQDDIGAFTVADLTADGIAALRARTDVYGVERDEEIQWIPAPEQNEYEVRAADFPLFNDPSLAFFLPLQWNMRQVGADRAWAVTPQGEGATVCTLDSGIDPFHLDFYQIVDLDRSASFIAELDVPDEPLLNGQVDIIDYYFHGTEVAGFIAGRGFGMAAVAPRANICAIKVLNASGFGPFSAMTAGILHAVEVGADVINMSLGATLERSAVRHDPNLRPLIVALQRAILFAVRHGVLVTTSAGNLGLNLDERRDLIHVPSQLIGAVSVGATAPFNQQDFDNLATYSNHGRRGVDITAPGGGSAASGNVADGLISACSQFSVVFPVCQTSFNFYLFGANGTSFAAPHVAGAAAVVESVLPGDQFGLHLQSCLFRSADRIDGRFLSPLYGRGRVDVWDAINLWGCRVGSHKPWASDDDERG